MKFKYSLNKNNMTTIPPNATADDTSLDFWQGDRELDGTHVGMSIRDGIVSIYCRDGSVDKDRVKVLLTIPYIDLIKQTALVPIEEP